MYRVFLFITFLAYCSSAPFIVSNAQKPVFNIPTDTTDLVDIDGGGYSYFKRQHIDVQPSSRASLEIPDQDLSAYMQSSALKQQPTQNVPTYMQVNTWPEQSAQKQSFIPGNNILLDNLFGQQQLMPRPKFPIQNLLTKPAPLQPSVFVQNDFPQLPQTIPNKYAGQQQNLPIQSQIYGKNLPELRGIGSQRQQQLLNSFGNQQPQQIWSSSQQKSSGFSSSYGAPGQSPFSSGFLMQSNQQNDQPPITNAIFMSSPQRFNPTNQQLSNNGW